MENVEATPWTIWYTYYFIPETGKVCICHEGTCRRWFFRKEELEKEMRYERFNLFLSPIYQKAYELFPKEMSMKQEPEEERTVNPILAVLIVVVTVIILLAIAVAVFQWWFRADLGLPMLSMGLLGDPFKTTRTVKVPSRFRVGHSERIYRRGSRIALIIGVLLFFLLLALGVRF